MLGRQSSLLLTNEDLVALETVLRARGDVRPLSDEPNEARNALLPLKSLPIPPSKIGKASLDCYLAPEDQGARVDIEILSDVKVHVSPERSEIIQFWRSYCRGDVIQSGGIYYTPRYDDEQGLHDKDPAFVRWAEQVVRAIRRSLTYDKGLLAYVGADAARKIASGELKVIP